MKLVPIILSGGFGKRLWPISQRERPKQFLSFGGERSLFRQTLQKCTQRVFDAKPIILGAHEHRFLIAEETRAEGIAADILLEPVSRNTCAAVAAALSHVLKREPSSTLLIVAADHRIDDKVAFANSAVCAEGAAQMGHIVTFGVKPKRPSTRFGYIQPGDPIPGNTCHEIDQFVEKPSADDARALIGNGSLWNSGNFLVNAKSLLSEFQIHAPELFAHVERARQYAVSDLNFLNLDEHHFRAAQHISFDHAIMEKSAHGAVLPVEFEWDDLGSWGALSKRAAKCTHNNKIVGQGKVALGRDNLVFSERHYTAVWGVDNCIVAATRDNVLVASRENIEEIHKFVDEIERENVLPDQSVRRVHRPWGYYEILESGETYKVKRITVNPGEALSLQRHKHRAEHWVIVSGCADVTIDGSTCAFETNQSVAIPVGAIHRLANNKAYPLVLIEVQSGNYLSEDDIERFDDRYNRVSLKR